MMNDYPTKMRIDQLTYDNKQAQQDSEYYHFSDPYFRSNMLDVKSPAHIPINQTPAKKSAAKSRETFHTEQRDDRKLIMHTAIANVSQPRIQKKPSIVVQYPGDT
jgi:hypothetical protein